MCQRGHRFTRGEIPQPIARTEKSALRIATGGNVGSLDCAVHTGGDDLRIRVLALYICYGTCVACQRKDIRLCPHIPDLGKCGQ